MKDSHWLGLIGIVRVPEESKDAGPMYRVACVLLSSIYGPLLVKDLLVNVGKYNRRAYEVHTYNGEYLGSFQGLSRCRRLLTMTTFMRVRASNTFYSVKQHLNYFYPSDQDRIRACYSMSQL